MITLEELQARAEQHIAHKPQGIIGTILLGVIINLMAKYIYDNCIKSGDLLFQNAADDNLFRRARIRNIFRDITTDPAMAQAWHDSGRIETYDSGRVYRDFRFEVPELVVKFAATMREDDFR